MALMDFLTVSGQENMYIYIYNILPEKTTEEVLGIGLSLYGPALQGVGVSGQSLGRKIKKLGFDT